jgi:site-specific recombinase XerD
MVRAVDVEEITCASTSLGATNTGSRCSGPRRADIECFARHLDALCRARATIARRLCTVSCFYRYAEQECLIAVSPAAHVRGSRRVSAVLTQLSRDH